MQTSGSWVAKNWLLSRIKWKQHERSHNHSPLEYSMNWQHLYSWPDFQFRKIHCFNSKQEMPEKTKNLLKQSCIEPFIPLFWDISASITITFPPPCVILILINPGHSEHCWGETMLTNHRSRECWQVSYPSDLTIFIEDGISPGK